MEAPVRRGWLPLGPPLLAQYGDAGTRSITFYWAVLVGFTVVFLGGAHLALDRRSRPGNR